MSAELKAPGADKCPFCPEGLMLPGEESIMWLSDDWLIKRNKVPYQGAKEHLLFIPREHITTFEELVPKWNQIPELVAWAKDKYGKGGSLVVRLGTFEETGSTVQHLHLHWIVRQDSPDAPTVYAHFGPKKYKM